MFKKSTGKTPKPGASVTADLSLIGSSVKVTGSITTSGSIRVDGKVDGDVLAEGDLILGEGGEINGNVKGRAVNLGGKITGSVDASEKITLEAKCSLNGNISSRVLVIEPGAVFNGKSSMGTAESEK